ncbi:MAG: CBS domain-containing protein [Zavarzinella sp.]
MICPSCGYANIPGADTCEKCQFSLAPLDLPSGVDLVEEAFLTETVSSLKVREPVIVHEDALLGIALDRMVAEKVGAVLVTDSEGKLAGIVTERDFLIKVVGKLLDYNRLPLRHFMQPAPETVTMNDTVALALRKMDVGNYRHLPVVDEENRPLGLLTARDAVRHITKLCEMIP